MDHARTWSFDWPVQFGGNIELDYTRHAAEENPMTDVHKILRQSCSARHEAVLVAKSVQDGVIYHLS